MKTCGWVVGAKKGQKHLPHNLKRASQKALHIKAKVLPNQDCLNQ